MAAAPTPALPLPEPPDERNACRNKSGLQTVRSEELLRGQVEVLIAHGSETYRLRLTRSGKLILQK